MGGLYDDQLVHELQQSSQSIVSEWGLSASTEVELLAISENATFRATDPVQDKQIILRVHRPDYHTRAEIESELLWLNDLIEKGIVDAPAPIKKSDGSLIASLKIADTEREVVAFSFMSGEEPSPEDDLKKGFKQLGMISAKLHSHTQVWKPPVNFVRKTWNFDTTLGNSPLWGDWRESMGLSDEGKNILEQACQLIKSKLETYGNSEDRFGLIHADLRLANLLIDGERLGVIDFDDCGFSWFMYDFATAISFFETDPVIPDLQKAWIEGYRTVRPLSPEDEAMLPTFVALRRILLTAWLASHSETPTAKELGSAYTEDTVKIASDYLSSNA